MQCTQKTTANNLQRRPDNKMAGEYLADDELCDGDDELVMSAPPSAELIAPQKIEAQDIKAQADIDYCHTVLEGEVGLRLDKLASSLFDDFSRASLQKLIAEGKLRVNHQATKPKYALKLGDVITLKTQRAAHSSDLPEAIDLTVIYEDEAVLVINKPAGLVVHPGANNRTGTLVNALLYHYPTLAQLPRAGLVHRIDKDTTGLLVVAKTAQAQLHLINQLKDKSVYRHYRCVVAGTKAQLMAYRTINAPIGRHPTWRTKMAVHSAGKTAITEIMDICALDERFCLLDVALQTGRTHQIRVHLAHIGHALVGDCTYRPKPIKHPDPHKQHALDNFKRQALHAYRLGFVHPVHGKSLEFCAKLPCDMQQLIAVLRGDELA